MQAICMNDKVWHVRISFGLLLFFILAACIRLDLESQRGAQGIVESARLRPAGLPASSL